MAGRGWNYEKQIMMHKCGWSSPKKLTRHTVLLCWSKKERMQERSAVRPNELRPQVRGQCLHLYNNSGAEISGEAWTSDDRARQIVTRTTRKDKQDRQKWYEGGGGVDEERQRKRGGESRSGSNGWVCVQINEWSAGLNANIHQQFVWQMDPSLAIWYCKNRDEDSKVWSLCLCVCERETEY